MSAVRILLLIASLAVVAASGLAGSIITWGMVDALNRRRSERESYCWWTLEKTWRVFSEYGRLYPDGPLRRRLFLAAACAAAGVVSAGACIGLFR